MMVARPTAATASGYYIFASYLISIFSKQFLTCLSVDIIETFYHDMDLLDVPIRCADLFKVSLRLMKGKPKLHWF